MAGVPEDLLAVVAERYGIHAPLSARRLTGGDANDVFVLEGLDLVLHLKHPPADLDSLSWEHRLLRLLADRLPEVPSPLPERNGSTFFLYNKQPVWLMPFRPGNPARPSDRRAVGAAVGRLHATVIDLPSRPGHARLRDLPIPPLRESSKCSERLPTGSRVGTYSWPIWRRTRHLGDQPPNSQRRRRLHPNRGESARFRIVRALLGGRSALGARPHRGRAAASA